MQISGIGPAKATTILAVNWVNGHFNRQTALQLTALLAAALSVKI